MNWEFVCMADGPSLYDGEDEHQTSCRRQRGHSLQHEYWNDDGSIRLTWWDDFAFGEGRWRVEVTP